MTKSLWVAEGVTSYYDRLLVKRAGLCTEAEYLAGGITYRRGADKGFHRAATGDTGAVLPDPRRVLVRRLDQGLSA